MAMNMVFSSAELANAGDSSSQLKTDGRGEGSWRDPTLNEVARDLNIRDHGWRFVSIVKWLSARAGAARDVVT
jgi:hypothetical protein